MIIGKALPGHIFLMSLNLHLSISDINTVLGLSEPSKFNPYDDEGIRVYNAKKRLAVISLVTAWETFIEDILKYAFEHRIKNSIDPKDFEKVIKIILDDLKKSEIKPYDIILWTGDNWKRLIEKQFNKDIYSLHTPNADKINELFSHYLKINIIQFWKWTGLSHTKVKDKLQKLIKYRGEFAHRGQSLRNSDGEHHITLSQVNSFRNFIIKLSNCVVDSLGYKKPYTIEKVSGINAGNEEKYISKLELVINKDET